MSNLKPSIDGKCYTSQQQILFWEDIQYLRKCPECGSNDSILPGHRGGVAQNIKCSVCHMVFWISPIRSFGAYPISIAPPREDPDNQVQQLIAASTNNHGA